MPEPLTLVTSLLMPNSFSQPRYWPANASLSSISSKASSESFGSFLRRFFTAGTGLKPMTEGLQAPRPAERILAIGFKPSSLAFSADIIIKAEAPSLRPEELPAVTLPVLGINAGGRDCNCSMVNPGRKCSSLSKITGGLPFFWGISTGTISSLKSPSLVARSTLLWLRRATSSISSRLMFKSCAINSAVCPMMYGFPFRLSKGWPDLTGQVSSSGMT